MTVAVMEPRLRCAVLILLDRATGSSLFSSLQSNITLPSPESSCALSLASKQFAEDVLKSHNEYRKQHQAPALKLSGKLCQEAAR